MPAQAEGVTHGIKISKGPQLRTCQLCDCDEGITLFHYYCFYLRSTESETESSHLLHFPNASNSWDAKAGSWELSPGLPLGGRNSMT